MRAECRRWRTPEALLDTPHAAPQPECGCGIRAYHTPTGEFSKVDYRGVSGIVTVWGRIEIGADEMRAELARVEALAVYSQWSRRQRDAVHEVAANLGAELVDLRELGAAAANYGAPPPASLSRTRHRRASATASSRCSHRASATSACSAAAGRSATSGGKRRTLGTSDVGW